MVLWVTVLNSLQAVSDQPAASTFNSTLKVKQSVDVITYKTIQYH